MNKHFNKVTKKYRYKGFDLKTKEFKGIDFFAKDLKHIFEGYSKYGKCYFIKHNYNFYWLRSFLWYFSNIKQTLSQNDNIIRKIFKSWIVKGLIISLIWFLIVKYIILKYFN